MEPGKFDEEPPEGIDTQNEVERKADDEPAKSARKNVTKNEEDEPARVSSSHAVRYYLLSPASHSYIYPLGIAEDLSVDVAGWAHGEVMGIITVQVRVQGNKVDEDIPHTDVEIVSPMDVHVHHEPMRVKEGASWDLTTEAHGRSGEGEEWIWCGAVVRGRISGRGVNKAVFGGKCCWGVC
nr:hypothetical protein [Tanacetum cinerariifolium]